MPDRLPPEIAWDLRAGWELVHRDWSLRQRDPDAAGAAPPRWKHCVEGAGAWLRKLLCVAFRCRAELPAAGTPR